MMQQKVKLRSKDGQTFTIDARVAQKITFVKAILDDVTVEDGLEIPVTEVRGDILKLVIDYCEFNVKEHIDALSIEEIDKWEREFMNIDHPTLYRLILAANFLDVQSLLDLTCKSVADDIKGKTAEQIRAHFKMDSRFVD